VFTYAVRSGYMDVNPTQGVAQVLTKGKPEDRRLPFTLDDVKTILDATKDEQAENLWIPRLALYTGARANELCGLLTRDVKQIDGVWCPVVEDSEVRTLKTASSTRRIPVHPELIRLGLLDFVERQRAARQARLLDAAAPLVRRDGGILIYATCSLEPEENSAVVEDFLSRNRDFTRAPSRAALPAELLTAAGDFQSLPQRHGIDGAYAACLVRT